MKIVLKSPNDPHTTVIETEHHVVIKDAYLGPIFINGDTCVSIFARDDGFEMNVWTGTTGNPDEVLPAGALQFAVHPTRGITDLTNGGK